MLERRAGVYCYADIDAVSPININAFQKIPKVFQVAHRFQMKNQYPPRTASLLPHLGFFESGYPCRFRQKAKYGFLQKCRRKYLIALRELCPEPVQFYFLNPRSFSV